MFRRPALFAAATLAAAALVLSACSGGTEPAPTQSAAEADPAATVTVRLVLEPSNLNIRETSGAALDQVLVDNVYQGLIARTPEQDIVPSLASDYTVSEDGLTYTFTVREGVTFHNGEPLTPQDVVSSLTAARDNPAFVDSQRLAGITAITANGQDVVLTLAAPDSTLLWTLTGRAGLVFKEGDATDLNTAENGTGPFTLASWRQGDSITLARYDGYWGEPSAAAEVVFDYIPDNTAALNAALAGELDVLTGFDPNFEDQIEAGGDFTLVTGPSTDKGTLAFNSRSAPLDDIRVREAIRRAIDHDAIIEALGAGQTLYGPIPELDPGYEDLSDVAAFDPEAARELLADAGAEDLELTLTIPSFYPTTLAQVLVSQLADVGITLEVDSVDFATWLQDVYVNQDYDLSFVLHTEARDFENWANPDYYFTYDNPEVQRLYEASVASLDEETAADLLRQAARLVSEDMAADWLYNGESVLAVGTNVSGMPSTNVNERLNVAELGKSAD
jgi:peptide/nickel transport system substrate-binding protein